MRVVFLFLLCFCSFFCVVFEEGKDFFLSAWLVTGSWEEENLGKFQSVFTFN